MKGMIPDAVEAKFKARLWGNEKVRNLFANFKWNEENFSEFLICAALVFLMLWGFAAASRALSGAPRAARARTAWPPLRL